MDTKQKETFTVGKSTFIQSQLLTLILSKRHRITSEIIWEHYTTSRLKFVVLYEIFKVRMGVPFDTLIILLISFIKSGIL